MNEPTDETPIIADMMKVVYQARHVDLMMWHRREVNQSPFSGSMNPNQKLRNKIWDMVLRGAPKKLGRDLRPDEIPWVQETVKAICESMNL